MLLLSQLFASLLSCATN